jgi:hypothetical protein
MQSAACHAMHTVEQRLARWLLLAHDRLETDAFPLTHDTAALMLGTTRPTVTVIMGRLQKTGGITCHRGGVAIVDRQTLAATACECYGATTRLLRVLTAPPHATGRRSTTSDGDHAPAVSGIRDCVRARP